jgi:tripartite ATP-independent transporter DctM subunit
MSSFVIAIIVFLILMAMIFLGIPVFVSMLICAFGGLIWVMGGNTAMAVSLFTQTPFTASASFNYAVIPLFMIVGTLAGVTGIAEGAFSSMRAWLGRVRGGMLFTVIGANAVFGACSGSSVAGSVVFGKMAMPELKKLGYNESYSMGCICASGALSSLIPPSMSIIMFCLLAPSPVVYDGHNVTMSVGTALTCGIVPGILTALLLCITVRIIGRVKKGSIPPPAGEKVSLLEKLKSLRFLIPILLLFCLIIGGTLLGWFPATIGGAIGAVAIIIYAMIKRIPFKRVFECVMEAAVMEGGIFLIILSGSMFSSFISVSGLAAWLAKLIAGINASPFLIFTLVIIFYIFCGCVMDILSIIIITVPVVFPVLCGLGFNPYVLVITLCFMTEIASITPPIGMNVFTTANALRTSPAKIFKGVLPYFVCELVTVFILAIIPQIVTILPQLLGLNIA